MSLQSELGGFENRRRRRFRAQLFKVIVYAGVCGVVGWWGYQIGAERAATTNRDLRERINMFTDENSRLQTEAESAVAVRVQAEERAAAFQRQYLAEVPQGPAKDILIRVNERIEDGISAERLMFVVDTVQNDTRCEPGISTKRFLLETTLTANRAGATTFADNAITVSGTGDSARDAGGNIEAWYDPNKPVSMRFTLIGGNQMKVDGRLPLHHSVVVDDTDYRFTVTADSRTGFVAVSEQRCAYP